MSLSFFISRTRFEAEQFYGELEGIRALVNFMSDIKDGVAGIIREFHSKVAL